MVTSALKDNAFSQSQLYSQESQLKLITINEFLSSEDPNQPKHISNFQFNLLSY